jgi:acyl carrier protein phosphodiesterase
MNYLAHAWLSFHQPEITVGNMISDFVKGKKQYDFSSGIQKGIRLHRAIDEFTDTHPVTKQLKEFFRPHYRLYAGAFADVTYDHFLANDKNEFSSAAALQHFSASVYAIVDQHIKVLPAGFQKLFPYMEAQDWLFNYSEQWLIERSFIGLERRAKYLQESGTAFKIFTKNIEAMRSCYSSFFPQLKAFATHKLQELLNG